MTYTGYRKLREVLELVVQQIGEVGLENELNFVLVGLLSLEWCAGISISSMVNQKFKDKCKEKKNKKTTLIDVTTQTDFATNGLQQAKTQIIQKQPHDFISTTQLNNNIGAGDAGTAAQLSKIPPPPPIPKSMSKTMVPTPMLLGFSPVATKKVQSKNSSQKSSSSSKNANKNNLDGNERQRINVTPDQLEFQIKNLRKVSSRGRNIFKKNSFRRKKSNKSESSNNALPTITKIIHDSDSLKKLIKQRRKLISPPQTPIANNNNTTSEWDTPKRIFHPTKSKF